MSTMSPIRLDFDPANADDNGIADDLVVGTSWSSSDTEWVATSSGDSLAHQLVVTTAGNEPGGNAPILTITGTDADGRTQTDTVTLPNATTVETTKYFLTITSASASAATIDTFDIGWVDEFASKTIVVDWYCEYAPLVSLNVTGTINLDIELTNDNPFLLGRTDNEVPAAFQIVDQSAMLWINDDAIAAITADGHWQISDWPIKALRLVCNSYTDTAEVQAHFTF